MEWSQFSGEASAGKFIFNRMQGNLYKSIHQYLQYMEPLFEQIINKIADPVLAILLFFLGAVIYFLYKANERKSREIKEFNKVILDISLSDKEVITQLKNTVDRFIEVEKEQTEAARASIEMLRRNNELLIQIQARQ